MTTATSPRLAARAEVAREQLLTRAQAADYLGIKEQTLASWATTKRYKLAYIRVGRSVRYRLSDLEQFLADRTEKCGAE